MNPREFLDTAFDLAGGFRESDWRSAISRAYYAAFHVAVAILTRCGFSVPQDEQGHAYAWLRLCNCGHADVELAGRNLNDLRQKRNRADYRLSVPVTQTSAADAATRAEDVIDQLELVLALPQVQAQITAAIRTYERTVLGQVTWTP